MRLYLKFISYTCLYQTKMKLSEWVPLKCSSGMVKLIQAQSGFYSEEELDVLLLIQKDNFA